MDVPRKPLETEPPRMDRLSRLPVFLALEGKRVVLAGIVPPNVQKGLYFCVLLASRR